MSPCFDVTLKTVVLRCHEQSSFSFTHTEQEMSTVKLHQHLKTAFIFPYVLITLTLPVFMWENDQCIKKIEIRAKFVTQHPATLEAECGFGSVNCTTSNSHNHFDDSNIKSTQF